MSLFALMVAACAARAADDLEAARLVRAPFVGRGSGAQAWAMGGASAAAAADEGAAAWNPGGLGRLGAPAAGVAQELAGEGIRYTHAAAALPLGGDRGAAAVALSVYDFGSWERRDDAGVVLERVRDYDGAVSLGWGAPVAGGCAGLAAEAVREAGAKAFPAFSFGGIWPVAPGLDAGLAVLHAGPDTGGFLLPGIARAGLAWRPNEGVLLAADAGAGLPDRKAGAAVGVEARPSPALALRAGYAWNEPGGGLGTPAGLAAGFGFSAGGFVLDYAVHLGGSAGTSHRFALAWRGRGESEAPVDPALADPLGGAP